MIRIAFIIFTVLVHHQMQAQTEFELESNQSMLMYGKGPGQDGTINPYAGKECYAIVENLGEVEFSIRLQQKGEILETIPVKARETKKVKLPVGYELYLDAGEGAMAKALVAYQKID